MKKVILFFITLFMVSLVFSSVINFEYNIEKPRVKSLKNGYSLIEFKNSNSMGIIGKPELPYLPVKILLPPGEEATEIKIIKSEPVDLKEQIKIFPYQGVLPYSKSDKKNKFKIDEKIYSQKQKYPKNEKMNFTTQFMNGHSILLSVFTPIEYFPSKNKVRYYKKIKLIVTTKRTEKAITALKNLSCKNSVNNLIKLFVDNKEQLNFYPNVKSRSEYDILLITSQEMESQFDDYVALYQKRGYKTQIHTVQEINATVSGSDLPEKIRNFIIQEYQNSNISFVTLAGDVEIVPYRGFYCEVQSTDLYYDENIPADLYYSSLDGTWNDDGDEYWGEIGEDDLLPEVSVGRISFSSVTELNAILHKIISYQDTPVEGELKSPLLVGEKLWNDPLTWGGDYLDLLIGAHDDNGYSTVGIPQTDDINKLYDRDLSYEWSTTQLLQEINQGTSFIHHSGHSNFNYNMRMYSSDITNQNFSQLNGVTHNYTLIYSHGCVAGGFDYNDCIAEKMVEIDNFALAYIGNSRYGWFNEGTTEGPSEHLHREFINALYNDKVGNLGAAHLFSKIATSPWVNAPGQHEEGALRWCFYDCNVLGDPVAYIWTDEPMQLQVDYPQQLDVNANEFTVQLNGGTNVYFNNLRCALIKDNILIGRGVFDSNGIATVQLQSQITPGTAQLIVSGYNCKPIVNEIIFNSSNNAFPYILSYQMHTADDDILEFGERAFPIFVIKNGGEQVAENLSIAISSQDEYIQTVTDTFLLSDLQPNEQIEYESENLFFDISDDIPNEHNFSLIVMINYNNGLQNTFTLNLQAYNALLQVQNMHFGNGEDYIMPGDTEDMILQLHNYGGADLNSITASLSTQNDSVTINNGTVTIDNIEPMQSAELNFAISVSELFSIGQTVIFNLDVSAENNFTQNFEITVNICRLIESFETGDFSAFNWQNTGNESWNVVNQNAYDGNFCAKSGNIDDMQNSILFIVYNVAQESEISFYRKVSSEESYDFLKFYIDSTLMDSWSGEEDWEQFTYTVSAGTHIFKWVYIKDQMVSNGSDCAWIDKIAFPIPQTLGSQEENLTVPKSDVFAYPNPFMSSNKKNKSIIFAYALSNKAKGNLYIYNLRGQLVKKVSIKGKGKYYWDLKDKRGKNVTSGIYLYKVKSNNYEKIKKITIIK